MTRRDTKPARDVVLDTCSDGEDETRAVARRLAGRLRGGDVVALTGPLGAGKTCFVRGLAEGMGIDPREVSSPTFLLCHLYEGPDGHDGHGVGLAHLDGYRLAGDDELSAIGWDELLASRSYVVAIEWADRFGAAVPDDAITVELSHVDERTRRIVIETPAGA